MSGADDPCRLTKRELEAWRLVAEGLTNKEIAARMGIGASTVRCYMKRLHDKTFLVGRSRLAVEGYKKFSKEEKDGIQ